MSFLGRLRDWLAGLFGDGGAEAADRAPLVCAVCGTAVEDPNEGCPLCGSHDVERRDGADDGSGAAPDDGGADGGPTTGDDGDGPAGPERRSVTGTTDDDAARLRDLRGSGADEGTDADDDESGGDEGRPTGTGHCDG